MIHIVLVGISQEALSTSRADILEHAARLQYRVDVSAVADVADLPIFLPKCDILAIEDKVIDAAATKIFQMLRHFAMSSARQSFLTVEYSAPIGEPCFKKWFEHIPVQKITIPLPKGRKTEPVDNIAYFESKSRKVYVKTHDDYCLTSLCLKQATELTAAFEFMPPYVGYLVNLSWVEQIGARDIILKNKEVLPLSQKRASAFRKAYREFCK